MTRAGARRIGLVALVALAAACGGDDAEDAEGAATTTSTEGTTTTTSPPRPTTTTSTIYAPGSVEAEVEQAYLRSWEVYSEAVYTLVLDEAALRSVYADERLITVTSEIQDRISQRRSSRFGMEHSYEITILDSVTAVITDNQVNHHVLVDPVSKQPIEPDPNARRTAVVALRLIDGAWKLTRLELLS